MDFGFLLRCPGKPLDVDFVIRPPWGSIEAGPKRCPMRMGIARAGKKPLRRSKAPEITPTSPAVKRENHEKYSADCSAADRTS
jgi:hypothetical protein